MKESAIQKDILDYLRLKRFVVFKHHSTGIGGKEGAWHPMKNSVKGISDIIACSPEGRFVAIEVKQPGKKPSPDQVEFIRSVIKNKGEAFVATSLDDVMRQL